MQRMFYQDDVNKGSYPIRLNRIAGGLYNLRCIDSFPELEGSWCIREDFKQQALKLFYRKFSQLKF